MERNFPTLSFYTPLKLPRAQRKNPKPSFQWRKIRPKPLLAKPRSPQCRRVRHRFIHQWKGISSLFLKPLPLKSRAAAANVNSKEIVSVEKNRVYCFLLPILDGNRIAIATFCQPIGVARKIAGTPFWGACYLVATPRVLGCPILCCDHYSGHPQAPPYWGHTPMHPHSGRNISMGHPLVVWGHP